MRPCPSVCKHWTPKQNTRPKVIVTNYQNLWRNKSDRAQTSDAFWQSLKHVFDALVKYNTVQLHLQLRRREKASESGSRHYGTKPGHFETSKIHFPTSEGVSETSERANE